MSITKSDYNAVQIELSRAASSTDEDTTSEVMIMASRFIDRLWGENQKNRALLSSAANSLVDIAVVLEKHKKVVKEEHGKKA